MKTTLFTAAAVMAANAALADNRIPAHSVAEASYLPESAYSGVHYSDWTGAHVGLQAGHGDLTVHLPATNRFPAQDEDENANSIGIFANYLWEFGKTISGAEADFSRLSINDNDANLYRIRARVGYDMGRSMPYLAAGLAKLTEDGRNADLSETGPTVGLGIDFRVTEQFLLGAEYSMQQFSDLAGASGFDLDAHLIQFRTAYRF